MTLKRTMAVSFLMHSALVVALATVALKGPFEEGVMVVDILRREALVALVGPVAPATGEIRPGGKSNSGRPAAVKEQLIKKKGTVTVPTALPAREITPAAPLPPPVPETRPLLKATAAAPTLNKTSSEAAAEPAAEAPGDGAYDLYLFDEQKGQTASVTAMLASSGEGRGALFDELRRLIEKAVRYPAVSRRKREEGTAVLRFSVNARGEPLEAVVVESSGYPRLDREALKTLARAAPLPRVGRTVRLPVSFRLTDPAAPAAHLAPPAPSLSGVR